MQKAELCIAYGHLEQSEVLFDPSQSQPAGNSEYSLLLPRFGFSLKILNTRGENRVFPEESSGGSKCTYAITFWSRQNLTC